MKRKCADKLVRWNNVEIMLPELFVSGLPLERKCPSKLVRWNKVEIILPELFVRWASAEAEVRFQACKVE